jgi:hypothetical protein
MPEKVTSLNGLKVTSEYSNYKQSAHNVYYVKLNHGFTNFMVYRFFSTNHCINGTPFIRRALAEYMGKISKAVCVSLGLWGFHQRLHQLDGDVK